MILSLHRSIACVACVIGLATMARSLPAQSAADSLALSRALGTSLQPDTRAIFHSWACGGPGRPCLSPEDDSIPDPLIREIARAAGARLVSRPASSPPCAWGYDPPRSGAGYLVTLNLVHWTSQDSTATVLVDSQCDNPPGYLHDIFVRGDEYTFVRTTSGAWRLLTRRMRWIT